MSLTDALDDANSTGRDILDAIRDLDETMVEVLGAIEITDITLEGILDATQSGGGGGGSANGAARGGRGGGGGGAGRPSKPGGGGGGAGLMPGGLMGMVRAHPLISAVTAAVGIAAPTVGAGIVSAARGGDFAAGFESNLNKRLGSIPFYGEATGFAEGARVEQATTKSVAQVVGQIEALGGEVSDEDIRTLGRQMGGMEARRQKGQRDATEVLKKLYSDEPAVLGDNPRVGAQEWRFAGAPVVFGVFGLLHSLINESSGLGVHK